MPFYRRHIRIIIILFTYKLFCNELFTIRHLVKTTCSLWWWRINTKAYQIRCNLLLICMSQMLFQKKGLPAKMQFIVDLHVSNLFQKIGLPAKVRFIFHLQVSNVIPEFYNMFCKNRLQTTYVIEWIEQLGNDIRVQLFLFL